MCLARSPMGAGGVTVLAAAARALVRLAPLLVLLPLAARALDPARGPSQHVHRRLGVREGLPESSVRALLAARRGDLWVGTDEGLARFDGAEFTVFDRRSAPDLGSNLVYALAEDASGAIWIGTLDAGIYRLETGRVGAVSLPSPLPSQQITQLLDDGHGTLWVGTRKGLARLSGGTLATWGVAEGLPDPEIRALSLSNDGRLWVGTSAGAAVMEGGALRPGPAELRGVAVTSVVEAGGIRWFATDGRGLARQQGAGALEFLGPEARVPAQVSVLLADRDGALWLGGDEGLLRMRGRTAEPFPTGDGTGPTRVWSIAEDREGNLWTGSEGGGLEMLRDGDFVTVGAPEGLPADFSTSVLQDGSGDVWLATLGGLAVAPGGDTRKLRTVVREKRPIISLGDDGRGTIWLGYLDGGVAAFRGGKLEQRVAAKPGRAVSAFLATPDGALLVGTFQGLFRLAGSTLVPEADAGLPAGVRVNALGSSPDGALWVGLEFQGAFFRPPGGRFERVGPPPGHDVNDFLVDPDGTVWIGTLGAGLWRWRAGKSEGVTTRHGLFDDTIWRILDDGLGHVWLTSNKGVSRVDRRELDAVLAGTASELAVSTWGSDDGMRSRGCSGGFQPAGWRTADGRLWVPTEKGVAIVDPGRLKAVPTPPVVIDRATVDGVELPGPDALVLAPGTSRLVVGYAALAFSAPDRVRFQYRLAEHDPRWIDAGGDRSATYTDVPPGRYRFAVRARTGEGRWSEPAVLSVEQRPRLTQRWWFWPLLAALLLTAAGLAVTARARQARLREAELRVRVEQALENIRRLEGLLPLCAWCKKVRDDEGYWKGIEVYLRDHGLADVTHGMCPECLASRYPEEEGDEAAS